MVCPHVHGDNPRVLASGLSHSHSDKHGIIIYTTYISLDLAHREIFRAKIGNGGKKNNCPCSEAGTEIFID